MKQTIHQWIEALPEDTPELLALYERARLNRALMEANPLGLRARFDCVEAGASLEQSPGEWYWSASPDRQARCPPYPRNTF